MNDYISKYNTEQLTSSAVFLKRVFDNGNNRRMLVNFDSLLIKYRGELTNAKLKVELTGDDYRKFRFNPKLFSFVMYGTTELWYLVLEANELKSATEFDLKTVWFYYPDIVEKIVRILNLDREIINQNEEEIEKS